MSSEEEPLLGLVAVIKRNGDDRTKFPMTTPTCICGRDKNSDIRIYNKAVSLKHCLLSITPGQQAFLIPLQTKNPTLLNGSAIDSKVALSHNDIFTIVDRHFRFEYPESSPHYNPLSQPVYNSPVQIVRLQERVLPFSKLSNPDDNNVLLHKVRWRQKQHATVASDQFTKKRLTSPRCQDLGLKNMSAPLFDYSTRKKVSFGPALSPEHFDKSLPPASPLRKGSLPRYLIGSQAVNLNSDLVCTMSKKQTGRLNSSTNETSDNEPDIIILSDTSTAPQTNNTQNISHSQASEFHTSTPAPVKYTYSRYSLQPQTISPPMQLIERNKISNISMQKNNILSNIHQLPEVRKDNSLGHNSKTSPEILGNCINITKSPFENNSILPEKEKLPQETPTRTSLRSSSIQKKFLALVAAHSVKTSMSEQRAKAITDSSLLKDSPFAVRKSYSQDNYSVEKNTPGKITSEKGIQELRTDVEDISILDPNGSTEIDIITSTPSCSLSSAKQNQSLVRIDDFSLKSPSCYESVRKLRKITPNVARVKPLYSEVLKKGLSKMARSTPRRKRSVPFITCTRNVCSLNKNIGVSAFETPNISVEKFVSPIIAYSKCKTTEVSVAVQNSKGLMDDITEVPINSTDGNDHDLEGIRELLDIFSGNSGGNSSQFSHVESSPSHINISLNDTGNIKKLIVSLNKLLDSNKTPSKNDASLTISLNLPLIEKSNNCNNDSSNIDSISQTSENPSILVSPSCSGLSPSPSKKASTPVVHYRPSVLEEKRVSSTPIRFIKSVHNKRTSGTKKVLKKKTLACKSAPVKMWSGILPTSRRSMALKKVRQTLPSKDLKQMSHNSPNIHSYYIKGLDADDDELHFLFRGTNIKTYSRTSSMIESENETGRSVVADSASISNKPTRHNSYQSLQNLTYIDVRDSSNSSIDMNKSVGNSPLNSQVAKRLSLRFKTGDNNLPIKKKLKRKSSLSTAKSVNERYSSTEEHSELFKRNSTVGRNSPRYKIVSAHQPSPQSNKLNSLNEVQALRSSRYGKRSSTAKKAYSVASDLFNHSSDDSHKELGLSGHFNSESSEFQQNTCTKLEARVTVKTRKQATVKEKVKSKLSENEMPDVRLTRRAAKLLTQIAEKQTQKRKSTESVSSSSLKQLKNTQVKKNNSLKNMQLKTKTRMSLKLIRKAITSQRKSSIAKRKIPVKKEVTKKSLKNHQSRNRTVKSKNAESDLSESTSTVQNKKKLKRTYEKSNSLNPEMESVKVLLQSKCREGLRQSKAIALDSLSGKSKLPDHLFCVSKIYQKKSESLKGKWKNVKKSADWVPEEEIEETTLKNSSIVSVASIKQLGKHKLHLKVSPAKSKKGQVTKSKKSKKVVYDNNDSDRSYGDVCLSNIRHLRSHKKVKCDSDIKKGIKATKNKESGKPSDILNLVHLNYPEGGALVAKAKKSGQVKKLSLSIKTKTPAKRITRAMAKAGK